MVKSLVWRYQETRKKLAKNFFVSFFCINFALLKKYKYSLNKISENTGISYETLYSIKQRRREAEKASFATIVKISNVFNVRPETIAELEIK